MAEKKCLLILGGLYLGDCFHCIPILNRIVNLGYKEITWITGTYEQSVVQFLQNFYPIKEVYYLHDFPIDINSRIEFLRKASYTYCDLIVSNDYDKIFKDTRATFELVGINNNIIEVTDNFTMGYTYKETFLQDPAGLLEYKDEPYICLQADTWHTYKSYPIIKEVKFPLPIVYLGSQKDNVPIVNNAIDFRDKPFIEVAKAICKSKLFVGIHSSCTCLAFYLNKNSIFIHPCEGFFRFGKYHPDTIKELIIPTKEQIEQEILRRVE
jgi:ADP-heptose:LPS heptosyltransferase